MASTIGLARLARATRANPSAKMVASTSTRRLTSTAGRPRGKHQEKRISDEYAHIEVVVAFLVVNFFVFLVITRHHGSFERRHQVEMNPADLPDLSTPKS